MSEILYTDRFAASIRHTSSQPTGAPTMSTATQTPTRIPADVQAQIKAGLIASIEQVIRDAAAQVLHGCKMRVDHPSYGYTKGAIRTQAERMEGQVGLLMVLDGQASHAGISSLATFADPETEARVTAARRAVDAL